MADDPSESRNSEYEFPEIPDADQAAQALEQQQPAMDEDLEPIDDLVVMEPVNQRLDFNVLMLLANFGVDNAVIDNFATNNITFNQLRYLGHGDLEELGITDRDLRIRMLDDFQNINPEQGEVIWARRHFSVIDYIHQQITRIDTLIAASMFNIGTNPLLVHTPGVILNNSHQQYFSPEAVLHLLGLLSDRIGDMQAIIVNLRSEDAVNRVARRIQRGRMRENLMRLGIGILMLGAGVLLSRFKRFGGK